MDILSDKMTPKRIAVRILDPEGARCRSGRQVLTAIKALDIVAEAFGDHKGNALAVRRDRWINGHATLRVLQILQLTRRSINLQKGTEVPVDTARTVQSSCSTVVRRLATKITPLV